MSSVVESIISELNNAIAESLNSGSSSTSASALVELRTSVEAYRENRDFQKHAIRQTRTGLALPSWMPKQVQSMVGNSDEYRDEQSLIVEALQTPGDTDNLLGLAKAIARIPMSITDAATTAQSSGLLS